MVDVGAVVDVSVDVNAGGCEEGEGVLVLVVMAGRMSETQSSRQSPCSCQSQSTTKSGTTRKKKGEGELKKRGGISCGLQEVSSKDYRCVCQFT